MSNFNLDTQVGDAFAAADRMEVIAGGNRAAIATFEKTLSLGVAGMMAAASLRPEAKDYLATLGARQTEAADLSQANVASVASSSPTVVSVQAMSVGGVGIGPTGVGAKPYVRIRPKTFDA